MKKEIKIGLATAAVLCVWLFGGFYLAATLDFGENLATVRGITGLLGLVVLFAGVFIGLRKEREHYEEFSYWQSFKTGVVISITVAIIVSIASGLQIILYPQYADAMVAEAERSLRQSNMTEAEIASKLMSLRSQYTVIMQMAPPLVAQSVAGTLFTAILSFFFRRKKQVR